MLLYCTHHCYKIHLNNRYANANGSECLLSVDGTDFQIPEPTPFDPIWFSHKFNGAAVRYEVGVCIQTGWICWVAGPFPAGDFPDLEIFRLYLKDYLDQHERVEADMGYQGELACRTPTDFDCNPQWKIMKGKARARHEAINGKFKEFSILGNVFRHNKKVHHLVFHGIASILQSEIMSGRGTFEVDYCIVRNTQW